MVKKSGKAMKPHGDRWFVYMVKCADDSLYTGIAADMGRRCQEHNAGTASRYTRSRLPVVVVFEAVQGSRSLALKREAAIKAMTRREKLALIESNRPKRTKVRRDEPKPL
jgi:predicted GIY-YIG superfamily endonuclease